MRSSEATASPADVVLPRREGLDRALPAHLLIGSPRRPLAARSSTVTGITNRPARRLRPRLRAAPISSAPRLQDVVCQERFLDVSAGAEQLAGWRERLGDLGDDSRRAENRELRAERGEQVTAMPLPPMIGMDRDLVDERTGWPLGADQDADRVGSREGDHAAAAPDLKVADRALERFRRHRRLVGKVRRPAAIQRVDEQRRCRRCDRSGRSSRQITPNSQGANSQLPRANSQQQDRGSAQRPTRTPWELGVGVGS